MPTLSLTDVHEGFKAAMAAVGITPPKQIVADGKLHRFATNGKKDDDSGWYVFHGDGIPAGAFGDWRSDIKETWCAGKPETMTDQERAVYRKRMQKIREQRDAEERTRHVKAALRAHEILNEAKPAPANHPYLLRKKVKAHGLRVDAANRLIVPIQLVGGRGLSSLQFISPDGEKQFLPGGAVKGGFFPLQHGMRYESNSTPTEVLSKPPAIGIIAEGFATAASLMEATGYPAVCAFTKHNLKHVAQFGREVAPKTLHLICGDNDLDGGGQQAAHEAAGICNGLAVLPDEPGTDWNDVHVKQGLETVKQAIEAVLPLKATPDSGDTMNNGDTGQAATDSSNEKPPETTILDEVYDFLGQFVAYPSKEARIAHTLWIVHTHLMDKWDSTPRIAFLSPEPGSGKTRALEITETLVPRPIEAINATPAYLFRKISDLKGLPTILYDEIDTIFGPRAKENEELRGVINAGHRPGAQAGRCVVKGKQVETEELPAYCAVAMAGLGNLPDTILSRTVAIRMRRRAPNEQVSPYRRKVHGKQGNIIRNKIETWANTVRANIKTSPQLPEGIADRNADVWEALIAVADAVGGAWPERARASAVSLVSASADDRGSLGLRLLTDLCTVFDDAKALFTEDLLTALHTLEESPWGDLKGRPLDPYRLSTLLKPYGVQSKQVRIGKETRKGYHRDNLIDAWTRYLPSKAPLSSHKGETDETSNTQDPSLSSGKDETSETQETIPLSGETVPIASTNGDTKAESEEEVIDLVD